MTPKNQDKFNKLADEINILLNDTEGTANIDNFVIEMEAIKEADANAEEYWKAEHILFDDYEDCAACRQLIKEEGFVKLEWVKEQIKNLLTDNYYSELCFERGFNFDKLQRDLLKILEDAHIPQGFPSHSKLEGNAHNTTQFNGGDMFKSDEGLGQGDAVNHVQQNEDTSITSAQTPPEGNVQQGESCDSSQLSTVRDGATPSGEALRSKEEKK